MTTLPNSLRPTAVKTTPGPKKDGISTIIAAFRTAGDPNWKWASSLILKMEVKGRPSYHRAYRTEIVSTPANGDTYLLGEDIDIALTFNTPVYVPEGQSSIGIQVGDVPGSAAYLSGSFSTRLISRYQVQMGDADANGISVDEGGPDAGFVGFVPTLVASLGLWPVDRYYPGVADDSGHKEDGSVNCYRPGGRVGPLRRRKGGGAVGWGCADDGGGGRNARIRGDAEPGGLGDGDGGFRHSGRQRTGRPGLHGRERNAHLRTWRDAEDGFSRSSRRCPRRGGGDPDADREQRLGGAYCRRHGDGNDREFRSIAGSLAGALRAAPRPSACSTAFRRALEAPDRFATSSERFGFEAAGAPVRPQPGLRDMVTGSSFTLSRQTGRGHGTLWGRGAYSSFGGRADALSLDGGVTTGMFGADYALGPWVVGLPLAHSRGHGSWRSAGRGDGSLASSLTGLYPYAGYKPTQDVSLWGTAGYGRGDLRLTMKDGESYRTDMDLRMAAAGVRGDLVSPRQAGGLWLAVESDALFVRTTSGAGSGRSGLLAPAVADVSRLRLGLEGSLELALSGGESLRPTVEVGLRHDGGDAETGFGVEVGGGSVFADPARGLTAQVTVRGLLAHQASDFRDCMLSGSLRFDPRPSSDLGPSVSLMPSWGTSSSGGVEGLIGGETLPGLEARNTDQSIGRFEAEAAYGLAVFGGRATGTPYLAVGQSRVSRQVRVGYRLALAHPDGLELDIEGTRRESTVDTVAPEHRVMVRPALQ